MLFFCNDQNPNDTVVRSGRVQSGRRPYLLRHTQPLVQCTETRTENQDGY